MEKRLDLSYSGTRIMKKQHRILMLLFVLILTVLGVIFTMTVTGRCVSNKPADTSIPKIYVITPTYDRSSQIADLTRLINTLLHVKRLHWIVIEDAYKESIPVKKLLISSKISYTYLIVPKKDGVDKYLKGIAQRNAGLDWIRKNHVLTDDGVFYFADDDNTYSLGLFDEIRKTKKVSVWPVGFTGRRALQTPILENGRVVGFMAWASYREFAVDMAGFAINVKVLFNYPKMKFPYDCPVGFQETVFLEQCCKRQELEPRANNCTKVLVWHTRTQQPDTNTYVNIKDAKYLMRFYKNDHDLGKFNMSAETNK